MDQESVLVKLRRRCRGTTQARVAKDMGVSAAYLSDVLRGKRDPGPKILRALGLEMGRTYKPTNGS